MKRLYTEQQRWLANQAAADAIKEAKSAKLHRIMASIGLVCSFIVFVAFIIIVEGCAGPEYFGGDIDGNIYGYHFQYGPARLQTAAYYAQQVPAVKDKLGRYDSRFNRIAVIRQSAKAMQSCMDQTADHLIFEPLPEFQWTSELAGYCAAIIWPTVRN